jgi:hypothetical protein
LIVETIPILPPQSSIERLVHKLFLAPAQKCSPAVLLPIILWAKIFRAKFLCAQPCRAQVFCIGIFHASDAECNDL